MPLSFQQNLINSGDVIEVTDADLNDAVRAYVQEYGIEDLKKESQNVFHGCMSYCFRRVFANTKKLICEGDERPLQSLSVKETGQSYDPEKLYRVLEWYTIFCDSVDKVKTICGFSYLTGIGKSSLFDWGCGESYWNTGGQLTAAKQEFFKKLRELEEDSLIAVNVTGKRNPVGVIEVLNTQYGHNQPGGGQRVVQAKPDTGSIAASMGLGLPQNSNN